MGCLHKWAIWIIQSTICWKPQIHSETKPVTGWLGEWIIYKFDGANMSTSQYSNSLLRPLTSDIEFGSRSKSWRTCQFFKCIAKSWESRKEEASRQENTKVFFFFDKHLTLALILHLLICHNSFKSRFTLVVERKNIHLHLVI